MDRKKDDIVHKFYKNLQKTMPMDDKVNTPRVTFNARTIETSFGGSQVPGNIKDSSILGDDSRLVLASTENRDENIRETKPKLASASSSAVRSKSRDRSTAAVIKSNADNKIFVTPTKTSKLRSERSGFRTPSKNDALDNLKRQSQTPECFNQVTIATPVPRSRRSDDVLKMEDCGITVAVRVRPFNSRESEDPDIRCVVSMIDNETFVTSEKGDTHNFAYDQSFWSFDENGGDYINQEQVYQGLAQPMLGKAFEGYNTCLFAYGQTGSGKSYSIMGHNEEAGIIPRFCEELFDRVGLEKRQTQINVEISYFEIYNEKIHDLLAPSSKDKTGWKINLKVREHPTLGPYVEELSSYVVESFEDIKCWLNVGNKHRATASTGMNDKSSRSHSVFTMVLSQTKTDTVEGKRHESTTTSKINLVDLAGSERQSLAKTTGDRLREGASINKSLMTLGKVISVLSEQSTNNSTKKKKLFIPYRDSVLTWLLKESLGGNSKTAMLATISPANLHIEETLSTLRYAQQARSIINTAKINEDPKARLIRELRAEIEKLRTDGALADEDVMKASVMEIDSLRQKLAAKEHEMAAKERSWRDRLKKSEEHRLEESRLLERSGIAFTVDNTMPNLVNLNEDPQLSEMLLYVLREGDMKVGRVGGTSDTDIQLSGPLIADEHCIFNYKNKKVNITPLKDAQTYVNGNLVAKKTVLNHGDRVILGGDHYFRFSHPSEAPSSTRKSHPPGGPKDFEFARQELIHVQNARLEAELEEARKRHETELQTELARQEDEAQRRMEEELARSKRQAEQLLNDQKNQYETKLTDLEKSINDHRRKHFESEQQRQNADDDIRKLQEQKMILEQEVLVNRKNIELEARAAQQAMKVSRINHSEIVEQLEREKAKVQEEVKRWAALRQQKREAGVITPRTTPRTPLIQDASKKDLYRTMLKIQEANRISQHLHQNTVFSREEVNQNDEVQPLIKNTNTKLGISTLWTTEKFENRLLHMRELYQSCDREASPGESEDVFYDPNDTWEKNARLNTPNGLSPRVLHGLRRQASTNSPGRLVFESLSTPTSQCSRPPSSLGSATSSLYPRSSQSSTQSADLSMESVQTAGSVESDTGLSTVELYRDQITAALDTYKGSSFREVTADKMLGQCNILHQRVTLLLDTFNKWVENKANREAYVLLRQLLRGGGLEICTSVQLLMTTSSLWATTLKQLASIHVNQLYDQLVTAVRRLANQLVLFLQGCENDIDSMVKESSAHVSDTICLCCRLVGEIAIATETPLLCLQDSPDGSVLEEDCRTHLSVEIRQHVNSGCEVYVERTLSLSLRAVEDCQARAVILTDDLLNGASVTDDMLKQIEMLTASSKVLLSNMQETQMELDSTRETSVESRGENYFHRNYLRNQILATHITSLADSVSLLIDTTEPLVKDKDDVSLDRVLKCVKMVQTSANKIIAIQSCDASTSLSSDSQMENSDLSILTDSQLEQLDVVTHDIQLATNTLEQLVHRTINPYSANLKRALPSSPKNDSRTSSKISASGSIVRRNLALFQH